VETLSQPLIEWSVAARPLEDHGESGDRCLVRECSSGSLVAVVDGLGHGHEAAAAAHAALSVLAANADEPLVPLMARCHESLRATRGAVLSLAVFSARDSFMTWAGVGNVDGILLRGAAAPGRPERLLVQAGVVGRRFPPLRPCRLPVRRGDTLILATDGIRSDFVDGLRPGGAPRPTAERILAGHGTATDDALVVVVRYLGGRAT
jgi:phosphoserine phosphatase RsbX